MIGDLAAHRGSVQHVLAPVKESRVYRELKGSPRVRVTGEVLLEVVDTVRQRNGMFAPRVGGVTPAVGKQRGKAYRGKPSRFELVDRRPLYVRPCEGSTDPAGVPVPRCCRHTQPIP